MEKLFWVKDLDISKNRLPGDAVGKRKSKTSIAGREWKVQAEQSWDAMFRTRAGEESVAEEGTPVGVIREDGKLIPEDNIPHLRVKGTKIVRTKRDEDGLIKPKQT